MVHWCTAHIPCSALDGGVSRIAVHQVPHTSQDAAQEGAHYTRHRGEAQAQRRGGGTGKRHSGEVQVQGERHRHRGVVQAQGGGTGERCRHRGEAQVRLYPTLLSSSLLSLHCNTLGGPIVKPYQGV